MSMQDPLPSSEASNAAASSTDPRRRVRYQHYIDGVFVDPAGGKWLESMDPATGEVWALIPRGNDVDVDCAVMAARRAFESSPWGSISHSRRGALLRKLGDLICENVDHLASVEMRDNGKLKSEVWSQTRSIAEYYYYFAGLTDKIEGSVIPSDKSGIFNYTRQEAVGVVACIMPWNAPLPLMSMKLAPALAAGCTVVLKPSEYTSASLLEFVKLVEAAGFPPGVVNVLTGYGAEVGEALISHPEVDHIAFTGGTEAGRRIAVTAAQRLKRVSLELGGKSPNIVFDDADLDQAVRGAASAIFVTSGQFCTAGSRLLVQASIHEEFIDRLSAMIAGLRFGHPGDPTTQIAPIANPPQFEKIKAYVEIARREGAQLVAGGEPALVDTCPNGLFFKPTIFTNVRNDMRIAREEVFGPVLSVIKFADEDEAVRIANDTQFGLAAAIWTKSMRRALIMADKVRAGTVWINNYRVISPGSPFGGFKMSGIGRENGINAMRTFMETKSVWISTDTEVSNPFGDR
jgi:acyl-CoA reductase-like NAD-dependent aldehyde dehydrogenase